MQGHNAVLQHRRVHARELNGVEAQACVFYVV
jgi:hypothetical protein